MPRVTRHLRVGLILVLLTLLAGVPLSAGAAVAVPLTPAATPKIIITELQTSANTSSEEFVELYNTTDSDIELTDIAHAGKEPWKLQLFSSAATTTGTPDWTKPTAVVSLSGIVPAHGYFVLAGSGYAPGGIDSDQAYSPRLSDSGGGLQLVTTAATATTYYDRLMWKQAADGQTLPAAVWPTPAAKGSLQRQPNDDSEYVSSDGILVDFTLAPIISPKDMWHQPSPPLAPGGSDIPPVEGGGSVPDAPAPVDSGSLESPLITELLPNPAAPLTDTEDEFIEIYNPNQQPFDLKGYSLEVGTSALHDFSFADGVVLNPESYTAFYARDTRLSLANSGGQARLLDPAGTVLSQTGVYAAAADGVSWSWDGNTWQWSTGVTPNAANTITSPVVPLKNIEPSGAGTAKSSTKKAPAKIAAVKPSTKVKGTTSAKSSKSKTTAAKKAPKIKTANTADASGGVPAKTPIHPSVLVAVVAAAVLYAGYEYRHDIRNRFHKLKYNRAIRAYARQ